MPPDLELSISPLVWAVSIGGVLALFAFDLIFHVRKPHEPTLRESALWYGIYVGFAALFGIGFWYFAGGQFGQQFFAGYVTEAALSVDNLFVFLIIMTSFAVPKELQQKVLLFGILFALAARAVFIFLGAALIDNFSWVFYLFGLILLWTAVSLLKEDDEEDGGNNVVVRTAERIFHTTEEYHGDKFRVVIDGKKHLTPLLLVMVAIGGTDVLFALDSIPAIFGLTQEAYIVFMANAFALMGLRQLFFLIEGLLEKLVYLSYGLAIILGFIGVKLILHALHENTLPFLNGGEGFHVPEIGTGLSLLVILGVLAVTVVASLAADKRKAVEK